MNKINKIIILLLIANVLCSCATKSLLNKTDTVKEFPLVDINNYIKGTISNDNIATMCFKDTSNRFKSDTFTVEINLNESLEYFNNKIINQKNKSHYLVYRPLKVMLNNMRSDCSTLSSGRKIILYSSDFSHDSDDWSMLDDNYKNTSLFIPPQNNKGAILYLLINNEMHMALGLQVENYKKQVSCTICYAGIPFTVVFDIITSPIQLVLYLGLDH